MDAFIKRQPSAVASDSETSQSSAIHEDGNNRPAKRLKGLQNDNADDTEDSEQSILGPRYSFDDAAGTAEEPSTGRYPTDFENALPSTQPDEKAFEAYEEYKSSQKSEQDKKPSQQNPLWIKGRSSIYVDAFNLALDTVLDEEAELFDARELDVFQQWKMLDYESQYLYVRLFLRKTAAWHRISRLGYYNDISDPQKAIDNLQKPRSLAHPGSQPIVHLPEGLDLSNSTLDDTVAFADASSDHLTSVEEAASLLLLDELKGLAKDAKVQGKTKADLIRGLCRAGQQQMSLTDLGLRRHSSTDSQTQKSSSNSADPINLERENSNHENLIMGKIMDILGPCIRVSQAVFKLFERVHLVFYRSTEWTEKSLTTIILAKIARRNFPEYIVCRTATIFASRSHLVEFEAAIRLEAQMDQLLEGSGATLDKGCEEVLKIFEAVYPRWQSFVTEETRKEQQVYEMGEGAYLRRFNPAHPYTRILVKATGAFARFKEHAREHALLVELLDQKLFHLARRGSWYDRKALLEENYMAKVTADADTSRLEEQKKVWNRNAIATCEAGLQDPDCHIIYHHALQKRIVKLEKRLRIPRRLQHDFGHVRLSQPLEINIRGIQIKRDIPIKPGAVAAPTRTWWLDELDSGAECTVEEMCLSHFRSEGWKGYHAEGGIVRTLFAYLFCDILFLFIPNVFQTAYQMCPLDLHTDAFMPARASEINRRLVEIANGEGERILREVWKREHERRTAIIGLNWDFELEDLAELVRCFDGSALGTVCKVMAEEYKQRGGGIPDLILWRPAKDTEPGTSGAGPGKAQGEVMFAEVKSENDRLSETQRLWIHVLSSAGIPVALCNAVAKQVREVD